MYAFIIVFVIFGLLAYAFSKTVSHNKTTSQQPNIKLQSYATPTQSIRVQVAADDNKELKVEHLRYFCVKDKGYHVSVWPKERAQFDIVEFPIAGITHGEHVDDHLGEFIAALAADPDNQYDPQAIKIVTREGHRVGFVPRDMTSEVRRVTALPCTCYCYIGTYQHDDGPHYFTHCYIDRY